MILRPLQVLRSLLPMLLLAAGGGVFAQNPAPMQAYPGPPDDYTQVGKLMQEGNPAAALTKAEAYLASKPRDPQMRFLKGVILRQTGKTDMAFETFTALVQDYPELPEPYNNLAVIHASRGQYDQAREALEAAIRNNTSYAAAHENLGDIYAAMASRAYEQALRLEKGNPTVPPKLNLIRELLSTRPPAQRPLAVQTAPSTR
ncbi:MAG: hypothetical protein RL468_1669 [Pseudomonadota bacterium]